MITDKVGGSSAKPEVSKQSKEKRPKHKVSGYKSQSKRRSIAGCRLLLRTLRFVISWFHCILLNDHKKERMFLGNVVFIGEQFAAISPLFFALSLLTSLLHRRGFLADIFTAFYYL